MADPNLAVRPAADIESAQDGNSEFEELVALALQTVAASSARVYRQTFALWRAFCAQNKLNPLDLRPGAVLDFIGAQNATKATRQRQLSALRKLAQTHYILSPTEDARRIVEALKVVKVPVGTDSGNGERARKTLAPSEANKVLRVWQGESNIHKRNQALIAVLALGALRRSEAAALQWRDVDFDNGVITVRYNNSDKSREVPLAGDFALEALKAWRACQPAGYEYIFCPAVKGDTVGKDHPISGTDVYRIVKATEARSGIEFKPQDLRRTFITEALATGTPLATVQAAAGHARGETTLRYAQAVDARRARKDLKLRYG